MEELGQRQGKIMAVVIKVRDLKCSVVAHFSNLFIGVHSIAVKVYGIFCDNTATLVPFMWNLSGSSTTGYNWV